MGDALQVLLVAGPIIADALEGAHGDGAKNAAITAVPLGREVLCGWMLSPMTRGLWEVLLLHSAGCTTGKEQEEE